MFPHEYLEVSSGILGLVQTGGRTHLGSILMPMTTVYKSCASQFLLPLITSLRAMRVLCWYL